MKRAILNQLSSWITKKDRKPLILQGVRQVGKTYILKDFGKNHFSRFHYLNLEKNLTLSTLFEPDLNPQRILTELNFHFDTHIDIAHDLLIFDEIQACPKALTSLKYFQEEIPQLPICAAGSLLGIHLNSVSYPVGKVDIIKMHPMSFEEFLLGIGDEKSISILQNLNLNEKPVIASLVHQHLWERLKLYFITGGLPEVVLTYSTHQEDLYTALQKVREKQQTLIANYYSDMAKHSGKVNAMHIDRLWRAIPAQLARTQNGSATKFKFKGIIPSVDRYNRLVNALDWLDAAGLIIKTHIVNTVAIPLSAYQQENIFKLYLFDVGILGALSGLSPKHILEYDYGTYKGYFAENFVAQAFLAHTSYPLYSWNEGTAEIEFLRETEGSVIPIEVKSGWVTQTKSLKSYAKKYNPLYRVIMSARELLLNHENHVHHYPLYLAEKL